MKREYELNINVNFPKPLQIVVKLESDASEARRLEDQLKTASDPLQKAVADNQLA